MFGLSRGAYTVRSVGGMINNCGIVRPVLHANGKVDEARTHLLCEEVYRIYRSCDEVNKPHSPESIAFRTKHSWPLIGDEPGLVAPVRFMGLFDTVGSLGIPDFTGGVGLDWPLFYNQEVSSVVESVSHAVSLLDRLYVFQPCLVKRKPKYGKPDKTGLNECWFPGVHYDLGRQRFRFLRDMSSNWWEILLARLQLASKTIEPNHVLGNLVLKWMLEEIKLNDPYGLVVPHDVLEDRVRTLKAEMLSHRRATGDGDVYANILKYAPFGSLIFGILRTIWGTSWQNNQIYQLLFALRDRLVPDDDAKVYLYREPDATLDFHTIQDLAGIAPLTLSQSDANTRYPSRTMDSWQVRHHARH
jgi:uncharacterized protein (DUF2235 family)